MEPNELALAYLNRNKLFYMDMLEPIRRGSARLRYAAEDGVLLYDEGGEAWMLTARDRTGLERMLEMLPSCDILVGHELWCKEELAARYGLKEEQICRQAAWMEPEPPAMLPFGGELRLLEPEYWQ